MVGLKTRRAWLIGLPLSVLAACAARQSQPPPILFDNLGTFHHAVTTKSPEAQAYFDQGIRLIWAFNHDEATRAFEESTRLDPNCAMAWWGIALAAGPNYNDPGNPERDKRAYEALQHAVTLKPKVSEPEQAYIDALSKRYTAEAPPDRKALDSAYADAMRDVSHRYPDDPDAATLFAESLMDLRPWDLWSLDGKPQPGTQEIVAVLEAVLARDPNHPGANHYYIHAVEASRRPDRGIPSAQRLGAMMPGAGHLVHMPAHIYMRVGRYGDAVEANVKAVAADQAYIAAAKPTGMYPMMYYPHNLEFLWAAASMEGRSAQTLQASRQLAAGITPDMVRQMSDIEGAFIAPLLALARFGRWQEILTEPQPPSDLPFAVGAWHYARGLAFVHTGQLADAAQELRGLEQVTGITPPERTMGQVNSTKNLLEIAGHVLRGELAAGRDKWNDAVKQLAAAVRMQDNLRYMEPPPWYYPVRQSLGAVLLKAGRAKQAEAVYRADLKRNPENGWALFGLAQSLRAQGKKAEAAEVEDRFQKAWAQADVQLTASAF